MSKNVFFYRNVCVWGFPNCCGLCVLWSFWDIFGLPFVIGFSWSDHSCGTSYLPAYKHKLQTERSFGRSTLSRVRLWKGWRRGGLGLCSTSGPSANVRQSHDLKAALPFFKFVFLLFRSGTLRTLQNFLCETNSNVVRTRQLAHHSHMDHKPTGVCSEYSGGQRLACIPLWDFSQPPSSYLCLIDKETES